MCGRVAASSYTRRVVVLCDVLISCTSSVRDVCMDEAVRGRAPTMSLTQREREDGYGDVGVRVDVDVMVDVGVACDAAMVGVDREHVCRYGEAWICGIRCVCVYCVLCVCVCVYVLVHVHVHVYVAMYQHTTCSYFHSVLTSAV